MSEGPTLRNDQRNSKHRHGHNSISPQKILTDQILVNVYIWVAFFFFPGILSKIFYSHKIVVSPAISKKA